MVKLDSFNFVKPVAAAWHCANKFEAGEQVVVRYADGTGQAFNKLESGEWHGWYVEGTAFDAEPAGHVDEAYSNITRLA